MLELILGKLTIAQVSPEGGLLGGRSGLLTAMVVLGLAGLAFFGLLYYRKRRLQTTVEERFRAFRGQAVSLMDQLDGLRERHKTLPATDPDFTVPMSGATLSLYSQVRGDLDSLWKRWLKVMEIWDQAQQRIRGGSGLGSRPMEEAARLLEGGEIDELVRQSGSCRQRLDRLNQGHEQAREDLAAARGELAAIHSAISQGTGVLLPSDPHHREIEGAETALGEAEMILAADPIGAQELIARSRRSLSSLVDRPETGAGWQRGGPSSYPVIDELAAAAERLRAAAARLRFADVLGFIVRAWVTVWAIGLVFALLIPLLLPIFFLAVFVIILIGFWFTGRAMTSWLVFGSRSRRRNTA
jgi:hypothetical protein